MKDALHANRYANATQSLFHYKKLLKIRSFQWTACVCEHTFLIMCIVLIASFCSQCYNIRLLQQRALMLIETAGSKQK